MFSDLNKILKKLLRKKNTASDKPVDDGPPKEKTSESALKDINRNKENSAPPQKIPVIEKKISEKDSRSNLFDHEKRAHNKHGIKKIDGSEDLFRLFQNETSGEPVPSALNADRTFKKKESQPKNKTPNKGDSRNQRSTSNRTDKNGIPIFNKNHDLSSMFLKEEINVVEPEEELATDPMIEPKENFEALLDESLSGKNRKKMLQEKDSAYQSRKPVSVSQKIKRYPAPQQDLDLHGFTSADARARTVQFVKSERSKGLLTARIIVGKGLHSEAGAVLPDVVEDTLQDLIAGEIVLSYRWEKKKKSKSGSVIVYIA